MRFAVLVLIVCSVAGAQNVRSAKLENVTTASDKARFDVKIVNTGERPITAFWVSFYQQDQNGQRIPCGGRGVDMIDWSDPMPGRGIYVHMRRNWIPPNGIGSLDGYPRCPGNATVEGIQVELSLILFDDGSGEGDSKLMEFLLRARQQARDERTKWVSRFTGLRNAPDLKTAAQSLYQDLVDATRSAEINPEDATREGTAKPVRDELQHLALEITQFASSHEPLEKNQMLEWRITDLERRTARLSQGARATP